MSEMLRDVRICPVCNQPQRWCDTPDCSTLFLPRGHWDHDVPDPQCMNLGDRNRDPAGEPDTPFTRFPELFGMGAS